MLSVLRYTFMAMGFIILGFNLAAFIHASRIVKHTASWRGLLIGESLAIIYIQISIYYAIDNNLSLTWRVPLASAAFLIMLISINGLYFSSRKEGFRRL